MLTAKKKIAKKELKQDALLTTYARASGLYYENKKYINYGLIGILVVMIGVVVYVNNRRANDEKATIELSKVYTFFEAGTLNPSQFALAIDGRPELGVIGLRSIVQNYGSTTAGMTARFYLANALYHSGKYEEALTHFEAFSSDEDGLNSSAQAGIGDCLEALGRYGEAGRAYERAVRKNPDGVSAPAYASASGRCYGLAGENADAVRMFTMIKDEYPESVGAFEVDRSIARFSL